MNVLKKFQRWIGTVPEGWAVLPQELVELVCTIRQALGESAYKLDQYLTLLFLGLSARIPWTVMEEGSAHYDRLLYLVTGQLNGKAADEPFSQFGLEFVQTHPLPVRNRDSRIHLYTLLLSDEYLKQTMPDILRDYQRQIGGTMDIVMPGHLFREMAAICGEGLLEELNRVVCGQYIQVNLCALFLQGYLTGVFHSFLQRDAESGRECFLLLLEQSHNRKGEQR